MRTLLLLGTATFLTLTGCSKHGTAAGGPNGSGANSATASTPAPSTVGPIFSPKTPAGIADKAAAGSQLAPGMWETTLTINSSKGIDIPGNASPGSVDGFGDIPLTPSMARKERVCLTPEEAAKGAPRMMSGSGLASCRWEKMDTPPGTINGKLICGQPTNKDVVHADVTGAMLPNLIGTQLHITVGDPAGAHVVSEAMMQGERVGDCAADAAK